MFLLHIQHTPYRRPVDVSIALMQLYFSWRLVQNGVEISAMAYRLHLRKIKSIFF